MTHTSMKSVAFDPSGADLNWWEYDIFTNLGVPKDSVAEIFLGQLSNLAEHTLGVRAKNSALNRYWSLREGEADGIVSLSVLVQVDSNGKIEIYSSTKAATLFYCIGYIEGVTYQETMDNFSPAGDGAWEDKDLFIDYSYPKGRVYEIVYLNTADAANNSMGARTDGSGIDRRQLIEEAEDGGGEPASTFVLSDATTGKIEVYATDHTEAEYYVAGYFDDTVSFTERHDTMLVGANAAWTDEVLLGFGTPSGAVVSVLACNDSAGFEKDMGVRPNGSAVVRRSAIHEAEAGGLTTARYVVTADTDANRTIELFATTIAATLFYYQGWFSDVVAVSAASSGSVNPLMLSTLI